MEATAILTEDGKEISRHTFTLPPIHAKELELMAEISKRDGIESDNIMAKALLAVSGIGLDITLKEYGAHRLREQIKSMQKWLPR